MAGLVGAGRTELARVLFGIMPADSGEILLNGQLITISTPKEAVAHGIAYVPEDRRRHGVILEMPIAHNMTMAIHDRVFPGAWLRCGAEKQIALDLIRDLAVKAYGPEAPGGSLSGGNQQKVSLARWLATKPKLLILDEPTQGVDVGAKSEIHKIIRRLAKEGLAVLMISSDLPEVLGMSDRIAVMNAGRIEQLSDPQELYERPRTRFVAQFLGSCNLIEAEIESLRPQGFVARTKLSLLEVQSPAAHSKRVTGSKVTLAIRPEKIRLARKDESNFPNCVTAKIEDLVYGGAETQYRLRVGEISLSSVCLNSCAGTQGFHEGETVLCNLPASALIVLED